MLGDTAVTPYSPIGSIASRSLTVGGAAPQGGGAPAGEDLGHRGPSTGGGRRGRRDRRRGRTSEGRPGLGEDAAGDRHLGLARLGPARGHGPGLEERATYDPRSYTFAYGRTRPPSPWIPRPGPSRSRPTGRSTTRACGQSGDRRRPDPRRHRPGHRHGPDRGGRLHRRKGSRSPATCCRPPGRSPASGSRLLETPSPRTPGGMKGAGESGTIGPPAAIGNAVAAALPEIAATRHRDAGDPGGLVGSTL